MDTKPKFYAVNVADLTRDMFLAQWLIAPHIRGKAVVEAEPGKIDGSAVVLECPEVQAAAIVQIVRLHHPRHELRAYVANKPSAKTWRRV